MGADRWKWFGAGTWGSTRARQDFTALQFTAFLACSSARYPMHVSSGCKRHAAARAGDPQRWAAARAMSPPRVRPRHLPVAAGEASEQEGSTTILQEDCGGGFCGSGSLLGTDAPAQQQPRARVCQVRTRMRPLLPLAARGMEGFYTIVQRFGKRLK